MFDNKPDVKVHFSDKESASILAVASIMNGPAKGVFLTLPASSIYAGYRSFWSGLVVQVQSSSDPLSCTVYFINGHYIEIQMPHIDVAHLVSKANNQPNN